MTSESKIRCGVKRNQRKAKVRNTIQNGPIYIKYICLNKMNIQYIKFCFLSPNYSLHFKNNIKNIVKIGQCRWVLSQQIYRCYLENYTRYVKKVNCKLEIVLRIV